MRQIFTFNQMDFLSDVMDIDGLESALKDGSCTVISAYFIKLALNGVNIQDIGTNFQNNKANIAQLQQEAANIHNQGLDGYGYVLQKIGLQWSGNQYTDPNNNLNPGQCALCLITFGNNNAHTIAVLYHRDLNLIYMFDPNVGIYEFSPNAWYQNEFNTFVNSGYNNIQSCVFRNVIV